ncbi:MAG: hypothetical protein ACUVV3_00310 [Dehalococcoidia bacterium]
MPTYRVYYKGYYHEHSEHNHTDVQARDELSALRRFFKQRRSELREADLLDGAGLPNVASLDINSEYRWWEGDWLQVYRGVRQGGLAPCPLCGGSSQVTREVAKQFEEEGEEYDR